MILTPRAHKSTLIWLHGLGDFASNYQRIFNSANNPFGNDIKFVLMNAPLKPVKAIGNEVMPSWFNIYRSGDYTQEGLM